MVFGYDKISIKKLAILSVAFISALIVAYYLHSDNENKLENFSDYFNYFLDKITFLYSVIILTVIFDTVFEFLLNNRETIKREFKSRGKSFIDRSLGPNFVNRSIKGGQTASNKIYDFTGRVYNYFRPNRAQINPEYTVKPLYAPSSNELQRRIMSSRMNGATNWEASRGRDFYKPVD